MNRGKLTIGTIAVFLLLAAIVQNSVAVPGSEDATKRTILQLEEERNRAIVNGDTAALERMTPDDYTFITLRGELRTKAEIIKGFRSGPFIMITAGSVRPTSRIDAPMPQLRQMPSEPRAGS